jgi:tRNA1Val (adenine37-N6)-methyltransferase
VTAWCAAESVSNPSRVLDLGCGIGSVLLLLAWRFPEARVEGVEAQAVSIDLARRSIAWNGVEDRCAVHHGDLRDAPLLDRLGRFDLVTGTPPYLMVGRGLESGRPQKGPCNFEHRGGIEAYCAAAARTLADDGTFVACEQASQDDRVQAAARDAGLHVVRSMPVVPRAGKAPLFAVHVMRRGAGPTDVHAPLVVRDAGGARTPAFGALRAAMGLPP